MSLPILGCARGRDVLSGCDATQVSRFAGDACGQIATRVDNGAFHTTTVRSEMSGCVEGAAHVQGVCAGVVEKESHMLRAAGHDPPSARKTHCTA